MSGIATWNLERWLTHIDQTHLSSIDLGLERIGQVWENLKQQLPGLPLVITAAGTNGKGSCIAMLEQVFKAQGVPCGSFTSPHILSFNERIKLNGKPVDDDTLINAFQLVESIRLQSPHVQLTYFEYNTLAALVILLQARCEVMLLEVGLGGRLDAVNIIDADIALITSIGIDHADFLGDKPEQIALEKAGIIRPNRVVVCADDTMPSTIATHAKEIQAIDRWLYRDYSFQKDASGTWCYLNHRNTNATTVFRHLPQPNLIGDCAMKNAAAVVAVVEAYNELATDASQRRYELPVIAESAIKMALSAVQILGRHTVIRLQENLEIAFDVAHNYDSMRNVAQHYQDNQHSQGVQSPDVIVFSALADKDIQAMLSAWQVTDSKWMIFEMQNPRAQSLSKMEAVFQQTDNIQNFQCYGSLGELWQSATTHVEQLPPKQIPYRILATGSFHTIEALYKHLALSSTVQV